MKYVLCLVLACAVHQVALADDVHVKGHYRKDGTYVQPHYRSAPDGNPDNNWSTVGNVNPYTGEEGTRTPEPSYNPPINLPAVGSHPLLPSPLPPLRVLGSTTVLCCVEPWALVVQPRPVPITRPS